MDARKGQTAADLGTDGGVRQADRKLLPRCQRGLPNQVEILCEELGIDTHEAIALANQHPRWTFSALGSRWRALHTDRPLVPGDAFPDSSQLIKGRPAIERLDMPEPDRRENPSVRLRHLESQDHLPGSDIQA